MSHPAIVAYENEDGTFDLHYSRNGAERYQLKEVLDGYLEGEYDRLGEDMPPLLPSELAEFTKEGMQIQEHELIEVDPIAESVDYQTISRAIPDITAEILYVVRDWQVNTYSIVPVTPSPLPILADHIELDIYDCQELEISPQNATSTDQQPTFSLSGAEFFDPSLFEEMSDWVYHGFTHYHWDLFKAINNHARAEEAGSSESSGVILQENWVMDYEVKNPAYVLWSSILVEVWPGTEVEPTYPWEYDLRNLNPRSLASELRIQLSASAVGELGDIINQARVDARTGYIDEKRWEVETRELARFITMVQERYAGNYSQKFSDSELIEDILTDSLSGDTFQLGGSVMRGAPDST